MVEKVALQISLFLLISHSVFSQPFFQTVRGRVVDADSKIPLPGATVSVAGLDTFLGASTDGDGKFKFLMVPVGRRAIKVSFIGYEEAWLTNLIVSSGKEVVLQIELHEKVMSASQIEIKSDKDKTRANSEMTTNSARDFDPDEANRYAGGRGDVSRMVENYAGVASGNDANNAIVVRGNSPIGVLWMLEGVEIPNPNHFATEGTTGGPISMINTNVLAHSDFMTGAFPAEYGNANAAVFDLKLRDGNNEKYEYAAQVGLNGLEFEAEGPISRSTGSSFLIDYRYSNLKPLQILGINFGVSGVPEYQDLTFKFNFPTAHAGTFSIWGLGGVSNISIIDSQQSSSDWSFTSTGQDLYYGSSTGAVGLTHFCSFTDKIYGKLSLTASAYQTRTLVDTLSIAHPNPFTTYNSKPVEGQYALYYTLTDKINTKNLIKTGVSYAELFSNYSTQYYSDTIKATVNQLQLKNNYTGLAQAYCEWQNRITDKLTFNGGLHAQWFTLNNSADLEPRLGLRWQFLPRQALSLSTGMHSQTQPLLYYYLRSYDNNVGTGPYTETNKDLGFTKSNHVVLGYDRSVSKSFRIKVESYFQWLYDVPVQQRPTPFSMVNVGNSLDGLPTVDSLTNKGTAKNYGIELTLEKFFSKHYYFLLTASFYKSMYRGSDDTLRYSAFSGGYVLNALGGYEIALGKGNKMIVIDLKGTLAGGNRYTPINLALSQAEGQAVYVNSETNEFSFTPYSKIDFKIVYKINQKGFSQSWFATVENMFNHQNILNQIYNSESKQVSTQYQLGVFPYGGYRIEF